MGYVDVDTHVHEPLAAWSYLSAAQAGFRPVPIVTDDEARAAYWWVGDQLIRRGSGFRTLNDGGRVEAAAKDLTDVRLRLAWMDKLGVDVQVVISSFFLMSVIRRPEVELALAASYNRFMAERWEESGRRLYWTVVPALGSIEETTLMMTAARDHGGCAVLMRPLELDRSLQDPYFDPVYATAQSLDMAVAVHVGNTDPSFTALGGAFLFGTVPLIATVYNLVVSGIPGRFPALRFGFLEASAGWLPFVLDRVARGLSQSEHPDELSREFLEERRFFVAAMATEDLPYLIDKVGSRCLVLGTDFGHTDVGTEIEGHHQVERRSDLSAADKQAILSDNGRRLYHLDS